MLFLSNILLHTPAVAQIHMWDLPSTTTLFYCQSMSSSIGSIGYSWVHMAQSLPNGPGYQSQLRQSSIQTSCLEALFCDGPACYPQATHPVYERAWSYQISIPPRASKYIQGQRCLQLVLIVTRQWKNKLFTIQAKGTSYCQIQDFFPHPASSTGVLAMIEKSYCTTHLIITGEREKVLVGFHHCRR